MSRGPTPTPSVETPRDARREGSRASSVLAVLAAVVGAVALCDGALLTLTRTVRPAVPGMVLLTGLAPWAVPVYLLALVGLLLAWRGPTRRPGLLVAAALAAAGLVAHVVWLLPTYVGAHAAGPADLVVAELNLAHGEADPAQLVAELRARHAELVVLPEATADGVRALEHAGLRTLLPNAAGRTAPGRHGLMVFARDPLAAPRWVPGATAAFSVRVGGGRPFTLFAAHAAQPLLRPAAWQHDGAALAGAVGRATGPTLVVGDLNATRDHSTVRELLDLGLRDAAEEANAGFQPTWPGPAGIPGLRTTGVMAIDHVLIDRSFGVVWTRTASVSGSDHRMLVAGLTRRTAP